MFVWLKNFFFCLRYPFYKSRNVWSGKFLGYDTTWYDDIPEGWRIAFGKQFSEELRKALKKAKMLYSFRFHEIKEKYGTLRIYTNHTNEEISRILEKYELLSVCYCINCGRPVRYATRGWVYYLCEDCFNAKVKELDFNTEKEKVKHIKESCLTEEDIPVIIDCSKKQVDLKEKYGIDFKQLWGLKDDK